MERLLEKKVFLISTLSADPVFIMQHVQQDKIITRREYNNLNHINHTHEKIVTNLLDTVMSKGDASCHKFMELLQQKEVQDTFPVLKEFFIPAPTAHNQDNKVKAGDEINEYKMSSVPRGLCLIINNITFVSPHQVRNGSILDEESLQKLFQWLGFSLHVYRNQTAEQMKVLLKTFSQKHHDGDCFVCCILSHGSKDGACRGDQHQLPVQVQSDSYGEVEAKVEMEDKESLELDSFEMTTIPSDADFLVAWSSTNGYVSFRETASGSWFIQSLCEQLKTHCPKGEDVPSILLRVNNEVGDKTARIRHVAPTKQMPVHEVTLRKKLVFPVLNL